MEQGNRVAVSFTAGMVGLLHIHEHMGIKDIIKNKFILLVSALLLLYGCIPTEQQEAIKRDIDNLREEFGKKDLSRYNDIEAVRTRQEKTESKTEKAVSEIKGDIALNAGKISAVTEDFRNQQTRVDNDIADIRKEVGTHSRLIGDISDILENFRLRHDNAEKELVINAQAIKAVIEDNKVRYDMTEKEIAGIKRDIETQGKLITQIADDLRREKAAIYNSLDEIRLKMSHLEGRFDESKFDAQKAKESIESVQAKTADKMETLDKFTSIQTTLASMEKKMASDKKELADGYTAAQSSVQTRFTALEKQLIEQHEKVKTIEEKASVLENDIKQQKESITNIIERESKKPEKVSEHTDPKTLYDEGRRQIAEEKAYAKAVEILRKFIKTFPEHELAGNAQYWLGEAYYGQKDYERAVLEFNEVVKRYPNGNKVPDAMVKQGFAFYELGNKEEAKILLERVISKYPDTNASALAKKRMEEMK